MSVYTLHNPTNDDCWGPIHYRNFLTPEECEQVLLDTAEIERSAGGIVHDSDTTTTNEEVRRVQTKIVEHHHLAWYYDKLAEAVYDANTHFFKYDITGFHESMQLLHYGEDINGGHYHMHSDCGPGISTRKLSTICQLTDPSKYEGCQLEIQHHGMMSQEQGHLVVFPSFLVHAVSELTKGERDAMVCWVNGPPFK